MANETRSTEQREGGRGAARVSHAIDCRPPSPSSARAALRPTPSCSLFHSRRWTRKTCRVRHKCSRRQRARERAALAESLLRLCLMLSVRCSLFALVTEADLIGPAAASASPPAASASSSSPVRPLLVLHVSMGKSAHVISAALVDPLAKRIALGSFDEEVSSSLTDGLTSAVANAPPSPLLTLLQTHAPHSDVLLYLDEKRLSVPDTFRVNSIVSSAAVPGASINAITKPPFPAQAKILDETKAQLEAMLQGGMAPWFIALDAHLGASASKLDCSFACLAVALGKVVELAGVADGSPVLHPGQWSLGSLKAGASGFMLVDPAAQTALNLWPHVSVAENSQCRMQRTEPFSLVSDLSLTLRSLCLCCQRTRTPVCMVC